MWPGWLAGARVAGVLVQQLTEACGPGMPGPYGEFKDIWAAVEYRNPSGAAAPPPFDKGGRGSGGVKTPPYEWKIQWQQTQSVRAGHARPLPGG